MTLTTGQAIGRLIAERGARAVFGVLGSGNFRATAAMVDAGVPFTAARHEMGATTMADAYARLTGELTVVSVHQGCGLTNAITGIGEAAKSHTPLLVIAGDTATDDGVSNFAIDQDALVASVGALAVRVRSAQKALRDTARAVDSAVNGRRPVVLSMPVDIQDQPAVPDSVPPVIRRGAAPPVDGVTAAAARLATAERPLIVAGRGALTAGPALRRLGTAVGAILVTTAGARGLFAGDPWALDVMGGFATDAAAALIRDADVIVAFGASLNAWTTRGGDLVGGAHVIQVDDRTVAFGLHHAADQALLGDAELTAEALLVECGRAAATRIGYRSEATAHRVAAARDWVDQDLAVHVEDGVVDPAALTTVLDRLLPSERVVVPDGGNANCYAGAHLRVPDERGYCLPFGFQAIGMGLSATIGAALAQPSRLPVLGTGDGAFLMSVAELETAVRLRIGMLVIVYNDSAYGAEIHLFPGDAEAHGLLRFPDTDIAALARGYGCQGVTVRSLDDLEPIREWLAGPRSIPLVVDAKIAGHASWLMARGA